MNAMMLELRAFVHEYLDVECRCSCCGSLEWMNYLNCLMLVMSMHRVEEEALFVSLLTRHLLVHLHDDVPMKMIEMLVCCLLLMHWMHVVMKLMVKQMQMGDGEVENYDSKWMTQ